MRRTTYLIDDKQGFKEQGLSRELLKEIGGFQIYYTLEEDNENQITYCLENLQGSKININSLNGYERIYIDECFDCFMKNKKITEKYKGFIKILEQPRKINYDHNIRYKLFQEYAKRNNREDNTIEYIRFIDQFSYEFESNYNKEILYNQDEFDDFLKQKIFSEEKIPSEEEIL